MRVKYATTPPNCRTRYPPRYSNGWAEFWSEPMKHLVNKLNHAHWLRMQDNRQACSGREGRSSLKTQQCSFELWSISAVTMKYLHSYSVGVCVWVLQGNSGAKCPTSKFLLLFSIVLKMMLHRAFHQILISLLQFTHKPGGGEYSHVKAYGDVQPKWVTFSAKILRHGSLFAQKKYLEEGPILQKSWKNCKISQFEVEKPLEMGPDFRKFWKKALNQPFFQGEKSLDMGKGFRPRAAHPVKK